MDKRVHNRTTEYYLERTSKGRKRQMRYFAHNQAGKVHNGTKKWGDIGSNVDETDKLGET